MIQATPSERSIRPAAAAAALTGLFSSPLPLPPMLFSSSPIGLTSLLFFSLFCSLPNGTLGFLFYSSRSTKVNGTSDSCCVLRGAIK